MIVSYLPNPEQHPLWEGIKALLEPATDDCPVLDEHELVWVAIDGPMIIAAATTVLMNDGTASILACGGTRHKKWVHEGLALVERWARDCGAARLTIRGRKGWKRYMRGWGATEDDDKLIFEKDLTSEGS